MDAPYVGSNLEGAIFWEVFWQGGGVYVANLLLKGWLYLECYISELYLNWDEEFCWDFLIEGCDQNIGVIHTTHTPLFGIHVEMDNFQIAASMYF